MKINEIIVETGEFQQGKTAASKLMSPSQWIKPGADYQAGKSAASKLMSPSQWFKGGDKTPTNPQKTTAPVSTPTANVNTNAVKNVLNSIERSRALTSVDYTTVSNLRNQIAQGKFKTGFDDNTELLTALKTLSEKRPLSDQQRKILSDFNNNV